MNQAFFLGVQDVTARLFNSFLAIDDKMAIAFAIKQFGPISLIRTQTVGHSERVPD